MEFFGEILSNMDPIQVHMYTTIRNNTEKYYDVEVLEAKND